VQEGPDHAAHDSAGSVSDDLEGGTSRADHYPPRMDVWNPYNQHAATGGVGNGVQLPPATVIDLEQHEERAADRYETRAAFFKGGTGRVNDGRATHIAPSQKLLTRETSKALVRTRVDPKTFFANERTFLQWLQIAVLVMFTALSLLRRVIVLVDVLLCLCHKKPIHI
jgi:hypothetical protein